MTAITLKMKQREYPGCPHTRRSGIRTAARWTSVNKRHWKAEQPKSRFENLHCTSPRGMSTLSRARIIDGSCHECDTNRNETLSPSPAAIVFAPNPSGRTLRIRQSFFRAAMFCNAKKLTYFLGLAAPGTRGWIHKRGTGPETTHSRSSPFPSGTGVKATR